MINFIKGTLVEKSPTRVVVENRGMGFSLLVSLNTSEALGSTGDEVMAYTHLHHREDAMLLFGFATTEERVLFELLIGVSGVGPKLALAILSGLAPDTFCEAVLQQDVKRLTKAPGVGKKTAERLVLELKDKVGKLTLDRPLSTPMVGGSVADEAVLALVSLGYKSKQAEDRVGKVLKAAPYASLEEVIRQALSQG